MWDVKKWLLIVGAIVVLGLLLLVIKMQQDQGHREAVVNRDIIYEGIYVEDLHIGGLSKSEALQLLKHSSEERFKNKELKLLYEGQVAFKLPFDYFEFKTDYINLVNGAYEIGKQGSIKDRYHLIQKMKKENIHFSIKEWYEDEKILQFVHSIKADYVVEPQDATIEKTPEGFIIHEEVMGKALDVNKTVEAIHQGLLSGSEEVSMVVVRSVPEITQLFYEGLEDLIGSFSTTFSADQEARNVNLRVASGFIDGTLLKPDEIFSANLIIGPTDSAHGYLEAPVIVNGKLEKGLGGGVCQVSTTLYNAVLFAELEIIERRNHSLPVGYIEKGRDATLAEDYLDFKFRNNTENPIYIESFIENNRVNIKIYGKETREPHRKIQFESVIIDTIVPPPDKVIIDPALNPGEEVVEKKAIVGYTVKLYKLIYLNDVLQSKVEVNTSYYGAYPAQIRIGPDPLAQLP